MLKTLSTMILRGLRLVGLSLVGLILLLVAFLMLTWTAGLLTYATMTVDLPNGAVVVRAFDWSLHPRVDLYASRKGPLLVRDIDMICWDETTIHGYSDSIKRADWTEYDIGSFIWTEGEEKALTSESPEYLPRWRTSSLQRNSQGACGLSHGHIGGELLLRDPRYLAGLDWSPPRDGEARRREAWARSPHRYPPRPVEVER